MKKLVTLGFTTVALISLSACSSMNNTNGNAAAYNNTSPQSVVPFPDSAATPPQVETEANAAGASAPPGTAGSMAAPGATYIAQ
jgi:hypothetical protein